MPSHPRANVNASSKETRDVVSDTQASVPSSQPRSIMSCPGWSGLLSTRPYVAFVNPVTTSRPEVRRAGQHRRTTGVAPAATIHHLHDPIRVDVPEISPPCRGDRRAGVCLFPPPFTPRSHRRSRSNMKTADDHQNPLRSLRIAQDARRQGVGGGLPLRPSPRTATVLSRSTSGGFGVSARIGGAGLEV